MANPFSNREQDILEAVGALGQDRLPENICLEALGGSTFSNIILTNTAGYRKSREEWPRDLRKWKIGFVARWKSNNEAESVNLALFRLLLGFWKRKRGNSRYFRFKDWTDYQDWGSGRVEKRFGVARLVKDYTDEFTDEKLTIPIFRPVPSTVVLGGGAASGTVDYEKGTVTGISIGGYDEFETIGTWTGEYDVEGHFVESEMQMQAQPGGVINWSGLTVMERLLEEEDEV